MRPILTGLLAIVLSGCFVVGGLVGVTSQNMHNSSPAVRSGKVPPVRTAAIGLVIGLVVDIALVTTLVVITGDTYGK